MANIFGLILQTAKCVIIPLVPHTSKFHPCYRPWLKLYLPCWAKFKIADAAEYLGFHIGPKAGSVQWDEVLRGVSSQVFHPFFLCPSPFCGCFFLQH